MTDLAKNKTTVTAFYDPMFNPCRSAEAIEKYVGGVYIQHNPAVGDGQEAFVEYFIGMAKDYPGKRVQLNNRDSIAGYHALGEEIWRQAAGKVDAFVHCAGTAASLTGIAAVLRKHQPGIKIGAVESAESTVLPGGSPGPHKIEGVGIDFTPSLWESGVADMIVPVETNFLFFAERSQA